MNDADRLSLRKSYLYRAQAIFYGRLCLNSLYLILWFLSLFGSNNAFYSGEFDLFIILVAFAYALLSYHYKDHVQWGRWLYFVTLMADLIIHLFFTRNGGFLLSPLMAIHPFLSAAFLLLFHNPVLMIFPLMMLPIAMGLTLLSETDPHMMPLLISLIIYCALDIVAIFYIHLAHSKEHYLLQSIMTMEKKLKELAIIKERQRIAREFHDGAGAKLASIVMQCDYVELSYETNHQFKTEIKEIKQSAIESIEDMRRSIAFLNGDFDIEEQIELMCEQIRTRHKISAQHSGISLLKTLSLEQQIACCRIVQEGLANVCKHAKASHITLAGQQKQNAIALTLTDNGLGFDVNVCHKHHFGIKNMKDRAKIMGAFLNFSSLPHQGTKISLEIPST